VVKKAGVRTLKKTFKMIEEGDVGYPQRTALLRKVKPNLNFRKN